MSAFALHSSSILSSKTGNEEKNPVEKSIFLKKQLNYVLEGWSVQLRAGATMVCVSNSGCNKTFGFGVLRV